jgi:elongation factor G
MGSVDEANTVSDFEAEAKAHHHSTNSTLLFSTYDGRELNVIDTPGHPEFVGYALAALPAVETALIVVNATTGVEYNTRRLFQAAGEAGLARMIVVNKIDAVSPAVLRGLVDELKATFGQRLHCMNLPTRGGKEVIDCFDQEAGPADIFSVKEVHREILESTIEIDDTQLTSYLSGSKIDLTDLRKTFVKAMTAGHLVPIVFVSARQEVGVEDLLHIIAEEAPSPVTGRARRFLRNGELVEVACDENKPLIAHVFKVTTDVHLGQLAMLRILQGKLDSNTNFICGAEKKVRRAAHVLKVEGREHPEVEATAFAGELVALARMEELNVDELLYASPADEGLSVVKVKYPAPMLSMAVSGTSRGDDVKLGQSLQRLAEEDPTFRVENDPVTHELVLSGLGDVHLRVLLERLKNRFRLEVNAKPPTIPYRETVLVGAEGHCRHKKQTGGAGQFAEVFLRIEPLPRGEGVQFKSEVFGGAIPTHFMPAVEKGVFDALASGMLAGFAVHDVRVVVTDGKSHPVDSKDIAFRTAGKMAVRDALSKARGILLEPLVSLEITAPEQYMGAITQDLKQFRARIMGMEALVGGVNVVRAVAPLAELSNYGARLKGTTAGQGSYLMEMAQYEQVPIAQQQKIVESRPHRAAEAE